MKYHIKYITFKPLLQAFNGQYCVVTWCWCHL